MNTFIRRAIGCAKLDTTVFNEIKQDSQALPQALLIVVLSGLAVGIASVPKAGAGGIFIGVVFDLAGWVLWSAVTYFIGAKLFPQSASKVDLSLIMRLVAFASVPGILRVFGLIPSLERIILSLSAAWILVVRVIAIKIAFDYKSVWRAVGVCLLAGFILFLLLLLLVVLSGVQLKPA